MSTLEIGSFVVPDSPLWTLGAGQTSEVTAQGITGKGSVTGAIMSDLYSVRTVASSLLSVTFTLDQPHEYHLIASSFERLGDDTIGPLPTDDLRLVGSDFRGWTKVWSRSISDIGGATDFFWEADQAGILAPGEYSFVANFSAELAHEGPGFYPKGGLRTFQYSLLLNPVPEPGTLGLLICPGFFTLVARARRRSKR